MTYPIDRQRAADAGALLGAARRAAALAGVTRLADITRLDRIGLPVWQAVRPASRALSVHQGKGASIAAAQLGALLEAVESDAAERFDAPTIAASWRALAPRQRVRQLADFGHDRARPPAPDRAGRWLPAERIEGGTLLVPFECVSLDFTRLIGTPFERASAGLATGWGREEAQRSALHELIERDAFAAFEAADFSTRLGCEIRPESIAADWFAALREVLEAIGARLRLFHFPSLTGTPVIGASIEQDDRGARPYHAIVGHAAHPEPEQALFQAIAEAAQGRLTYIAGARDDCYPWHYREGTAAIAALAPPPVVGIDGMDFAQIPPGPRDLATLAARLAAKGFDELAFLPIKQVEGFAIERAFAPGLGSLAKARRA
ncbi:YcaO-like family protein [Sphingomicrobium astaxanthinifaciens]|uniref:YcaO-like family protein n=1 Tax=Sphingomicrobium astaxanthinifaciens TaxID=1227949 RepID=UPI001FCAFE0E|nr:YcaO-like family protein [Sphingomicrobium astaxanthinifaciens]MCJ7420243.1 YcaO-like family protein [Sphingomicrobium astaxanthinifaciens]